MSNHCAMCMDLGGIMLSEISQMENDRKHDFTDMQNTKQKSNK